MAKAKNHGPRSCLLGPNPTVIGGGHTERDSAVDEKRYIDKTKEDQNAALDRYVL